MDADLRALLPDPRFQRVVQHLMVKCNTFDLIETLQAGIDFRNQARRGVGVELHKEMMRADPETASALFAQMFVTILEPQDVE